ncbi:hypothetical protein [Bacteroides sp. 519]|uniref:hypothetical protein n=1 Tax=Bacteroides sp. 519 TaxID=2302937 RepID=UPI0013D5DDC0|nr:hypothetical protein [Bacteroides sp. 519]NDV57371.1 hypothetical protein [Bacteroides sp. 519]
MSILENNFDAAITYMKELVEKEKSNTPSEYYIGQVAYNEKSFELYSAALIPSSTGKVTRNMMNDRYYNLLFVTKGLDNVVQQFRDKYIFKVAQADISFALYQAYRGVLTSNNGEYTLKTSFYKPGIKDSTWAYKDVFHYTDLGHFLCWFNHDEDYKEVEIQAESDFIKQYDEYGEF